VQSATLQTFTIATNEYRAGNAERTEYHPCVAWDRLADTGQFLSKGQLVVVEGRLQTRPRDVTPASDTGNRGFISPYPIREWIQATPEE
jgi:single-stranded DNA-binding protein